MSESTRPDAEQLVSDYEALLNGDTSKLSVLSEAFTYYSPGVSEEGMGREAFEEYLNASRVRFPDLRVTMENDLVGEEVTMQEWKMAGTHEGEVDGVPPTGREMELYTMTTTVVSDGKIHEVREYFDTQELAAQMEPEE